MHPLLVISRKETTIHPKLLIYYAYVVRNATRVAF